MKQTQADYNRGYNEAINDIKKYIKENNETDKALVYMTLTHWLPYCPQFSRKTKNGGSEYVVVWTKYAKGYNQALLDYDKGDLKV